jgi:hypothetical protein
LLIAAFEYVDNQVVGAAQFHRCAPQKAAESAAMAATAGCFVNEDTIDLNVSAENAIKIKVRLWRF